MPIPGKSYKPASAAGLAIGAAAGRAICIRKEISLLLENAIMLHATQGRDASEGAIPIPGAQVADLDERVAHIASIHAAGQELTALLRFADGHEIMVPAGALSLQPDGGYRVDLQFSAFETAGQHELQAVKRTLYVGDGVRIRKSVSEREETLDVPLLQDEIVVERIPVGQILTTVDLPQPRYDGDTLIVPVFEEVLVVEKRMRLVEEVRVTKHRRSTIAHREVNLQAERAEVEGMDKAEPGVVPH